MSKSENLYNAARELIPGGVNSPVRAFTGVGGTPLFIERADGAYLYDVDGKAYIDYVGSWGPMVLGHNHPAIRNAVIEAAERGLSFGAPTEMEVKMAALVTELVPTMDMVRMVNSGTEATMSAIRLARGFTGRDKIIKFEGCYHGHADCLLVKAGSGALTLGQPNSPGVPADFAKHTLTCTYNDLSSVRAAFEQYPQDIACIIVEPVAGNMNCIPPLPEFLPGLRVLCDEFGALLIIDEVMTGFRVALALLGGTLSTFLYSGAGAVLSWFGMLLIKQLGEKRVSMIGISAAGGILHNVGQLLVASLIAQSWTVMLYLPVLAFMGILAGIAVGIAANFLFEHIDILRRLRYDRTKRRKKGATHENSSHVA